MPANKSRRCLKLEVGAPQRHEGDSNFIRGVAEIIKDGPGTNSRRNVLLQSLQEGAIACSVRVSDPQEQQGVISGFFVRLQVRGRAEDRLFVVPTDARLPATTTSAIHQHAGDRINEFLREKNGKSIRELAKIS